MKGPQANDRRFPLPRRTGHGDFPHPALARVVYARERSQRHKAQVFQMSIQADALAHTPTALTAPAQVLTQPLPHEVIEVSKPIARIAQFEIVGPSSQVSIELPNQLRQRGEALLGTDELAHRFSFSGHRLARRLQIPVALRSPILVEVISEGVAQKIQALAGLSQVQHASLFAIELQPQPSFEFAPDPSAQLRTDVASQYDEVVRVANQLCPGPLRRSIRPLKPVVEPVQVDVGQQLYRSLRFILFGD